MVGGDGAEALKRIREIEENLDKRYGTAEKKADETLNRARFKAREIVDRKKEELAKANLLRAELEDETDITASTAPQGELPEEALRTVETIAAKLFDLFMERKSGGNP